MFRASRTEFHIRDACKATCDRDRANASAAILQPARATARPQIPCGPLRLSMRCGYSLLRRTNLISASANYSSIAEFFVQPLGFVMCYERVNDRCELAFHHLIELMKCQADAMIAHAILRKIVSADFFGAVASFNLPATLGGNQRVLLLLLLFVETRAENAHGLSAILDLRFFVLLRNDQARRDVRDAYRRIGSVHRLSAGTGGAESIYAQILGLNLDINFIGFGKHRNRCGGSVNASLLLGSRNALHAMDSALVFQLRENFVALNCSDDFLHSADGRWRAFQNFNAPALRFGIA